MARSKASSSRTASSRHVDGWGEEHGGVPRVHIPFALRPVAHNVRETCDAAGHGAASSCRLSRTSDRWRRLVLLPCRISHWGGRDDEATKVPQSAGIRPLSSSSRPLSQRAMYRREACAHASSTVPVSIDQFVPRLGHADCCCRRSAASPLLADVSRMRASESWIVSMSARSVRMRTT